MCTVQMNQYFPKMLILTNAKCIVLDLLNSANADNIRLKVIHINITILLAS